MTVGYGDIVPVDNTSRLVVVMELAFSFITVAYALSMLGMLRRMFIPGGEGVEVEGAEEVKASKPYPEKHKTL